jgi:hypothetical protein
MSKSSRKFFSPLKHYEMKTPGIQCRTQPLKHYEMKTPGIQCRTQHEHKTGRVWRHVAKSTFSIYVNGFQLRERPVRDVRNKRIE